ncbi:MAG: 4-hydroxyphenylpyruvate dioxygenase [Cyanobacteria bacterium P01_D01_bin.1]
MHFHHLHFYVQDTALWKEWFSQKLSFDSISEDPIKPDSIHPHQVLKQGNIEIRLSDPNFGPDSDANKKNAANQADDLVSSSCEVARYLQRHPPGLVDVAFATEKFDAVLKQALSQGASLSKPITFDEFGQRQCQLEGWAHLCHTLVEVSSNWVKTQNQSRSAPNTKLSDIDHAVINVPQGELQLAATWYQKVFGMTSCQQFDIQTARSGLHSQVLVHPDGPLQLPINEPSSSNSQIQEFLLHNRGAGVQHVALRSGNAVAAIAHFRAQGLDLLDIPRAYYDSLYQRSDCPVEDLSDISRQQILVDWPHGGQQGMLLQTFTQPIFAEPTFFFEIIERRSYLENGQLKVVKGFGEGNFQALFEAIERSQLERSPIEG